MLTLYLSEMLIHTAKIEKDVDIIRQLLCEDQLFHPYSVYKYLDSINSNSKGKIDHTDICTFLEKNGFIRSIQESKIFICNYDQDNDGTLQYGEFLKAVLPIHNQDLRQSTSLKQPYETFHLDSQTEYVLAKLINAQILLMLIFFREIELTYSSEQYKFNLMKEINNQPEIAFNLLDYSKSGSINPSDIEHFFWSNSILIYQDEIKGIFRRIDLLNDSVIDLYEFTRYLTLPTNSSVKNSSHFQSSQFKQSRYSETQSSPFKGISSLHRRTQTDAMVAPTFGNSHLKQSYADVQPTDQFDQFVMSSREINDNSPTRNLYNSKSPFDRSLLVRSQGQQSYVSTSLQKKSQIKFDNTMSNVLTQSKVNKNTKILNNQKSISPQQQKNKTPEQQKYLKQKTNLRAQMEYSKLSGQKKKRPISRQKKSVPQNKQQGQVNKEQGQVAQNKQQEFIKKYSPNKKFSQQRQFSDPDKYVCELLMDLLGMENRVEQKKIQLARQEEFNLFDAFKVIDIDRIGYVTSTDLDYFMGSKRGSMDILVENWGIQGKKLRFSDFIQMIQPNSPDFKQYLQEKKPLIDQKYLYGEKLFNKETILMFKQLLQSLVENELNLMKLQQRMVTNKYMSLKECFMIMDRYTNDGIISIRDVIQVEQLCNDNGLNLNYNEMQLLLGKLDYNGDSKVTEQDWIQVMSNKK